ncbi:MAG: porin, partial [Gammaproteobacteria bacterium]|nr:porin [Gammaproteobacteria bacterium]
GSYSTSNIGASYKAGTATIIVNYNSNKNGKGDKADSYLIGGVVKLSDTSTVPISYNKYSGKGGTISTQSASQFAIGFTNALSARTTFYGTVATVSNSGGSNISVSNAPAPGTATNFSSNGFEVGVAHKF